MVLFSTSLVILPSVLWQACITHYSIGLHLIAEQCHQMKSVYRQMDYHEYVDRLNYSKRIYIKEKKHSGILSYVERLPQCIFRALSFVGARHTLCRRN